MLNITYLSHSCFLLDDGENQLIIDPFLTGNPTATVGPDDIKAKFIALTHAHGDHLGDAVPIAKANNGLIIAVNELADFVAGQGANAHNMHIGGSYEFPFGTIKFTIAHHGSASPDGQYMGEPAGIVVKMGGKTFYHTGDTGLFSDMKLIGEMDDIDVMALPIGDNFTMGIKDAMMAARFAEPNLVIPMHYNTFPVIEADPYEFSKKVEAIGIASKVMEIGETISV
ncbi:MAG: metal-dependent hydrolase [Candidatus Kapabacteria bacterium]|jgi:L-ascorbate metabolism protein UlaG (beta-lactamase superfamily)|nr:metal-dependent hydrolase [Candidatus Kapabacteria bacterium]